VEEVLALVELEAVADRRVKTYSLGMRQRLALAGALLGGPEVLVLDEPANALDPAGVRWLRQFLRRFAEQGGTVLVSSHMLAEAGQTVDQVVIIDRGRLVATGRLVRLAARTGKIGRMAVAAAARGHGAGAAVLAELERVAVERGLDEIVLHAQLSAKGFYDRAGYLTEGGVFDEAGIQHVRMRKRLR
jgi:ABC-2 type transport system ATP-binding protein